MKPHIQINGYRLTEREHAVWQGVALGLPSKEIAGALGTTTDTVMAHRRNLYRKLGVNCAARATLEAVRHGVVAVEVLKSNPNARH